MTGREPADELFSGNDATRRGQALEPVSIPTQKNRHNHNAISVDVSERDCLCLLGRAPSVRDAILEGRATMRLRCT